MEKGTLYLFTGLSGAGKTTLGTLFYRRLREHKANVFLFDNDGMKAVFSDDPGGYDTANRIRRGYRSLRLCKALCDQGIDVVCCIIAMYGELLDWCRENVENYREIYIHVPMEVLRARDQKGLYSSGVKDVVGVDLPFDEPEAPDVVLDNDGGETPETMIDQLEKELGLR